jgi:hypothetical protein
MTIPSSLRMALMSGDIDAETGMASQAMQRNPHRNYGELLESLLEAITT